MSKAKWGIIIFLIIIVMFSAIAMARWHLIPEKEREEIRAEWVDEDRRDKLSETQVGRYQLLLEDSIKIEKSTYKICTFINDTEELKEFTESRYLDSEGYEILISSIQADGLGSHPKLELLFDELSKAIDKTVECRESKEMQFR